MIHVMHVSRPDPWDRACKNDQSRIIILIELILISLGDFLVVSFFGGIVPGTKNVHLGSAYRAISDPDVCVR
jgi:hypothetical protein